MKLAYFSPLPPQKSGISDYSEALLPSLARYFHIDLWVTGSPEGTITKQFRVFPYRIGSYDARRLETYDHILYNIGNNPEFHGEMYDIFLDHPGHVILHDFVLYFLITGYYLDLKRDPEGYLREFYENFGNEGISGAKEILRSATSPLQFTHPESYPLIRRIVREAPGIIVHSEYSRQLLMAEGCPPEKIIRINQINYSNLRYHFPARELNQTKKRLGIDPGTVLIASLGYIAPTKRNAEVIRAVREVMDLSPSPVQYLMIGEGNYVDALLDATVKKTGFVSRKEYELLLSCSDIIVNLRTPSMGETSATLLQAMNAGKPCIVTDTAWFSELPDDTVMKISAQNAREHEDLKSALLLLLSDQKKRTDLGLKAREYVLRHHDPDFIAEQFFRFITGEPSQSSGFVPANHTIHTNHPEEIAHREIRDDFSACYHRIMAERLREIGFPAQQDPSSRKSFFAIFKRK